MILGSRTNAPSLLLLLASFACAEEGGVPYGFEAAPRQNFVFESEERTTIDGTEVTVVRYAELSLEASSDESRTELAMRLKRYYLTIDGAPGGTVEFALSDAGLVTRTPTAGEHRLDADQPTPGGRTVAAVLRRPVGGAFFGAHGELLGEPWQSYEPSLGDLPLVDWIVLALPVLNAGDARAWEGRRPVPPLGQYQLGLEIPLRFIRVGEPGAQHLVRSSGQVRRTSIRLAPGFEGRLELDHSGEAKMSADGQVKDARLELRVTFIAEDGSEITARYRVRLRQPDADPTFNPLPKGSDTAGE